MSLLGDLVRRAEAVVRSSGSAQASRVSVRLGPLSHLSAAHLSSHFARLTQGTSLHGAVLDIEQGTDVAAPDAMDLTLVAVDVMAGEG
jgi:Zn finger protein HypA/HybF involved in hydrogenase expression